MYKFGEAGRAQLPHPKYLLMDEDTYNGSQQFREANRSLLALTLVSASEFSNLGWKKRALHMASRINPEKDDMYMRALTTFLESVTLRFCNEPDRSSYR